MSQPSELCPAHATPSPRYCVWIVDRGDWQPTDALDVPPRLLAIEPAEERCLSALEAEAYISGFNQQALATHLPYWAVRVPLVECLSQCEVSLASERLNKL